MKKIEQPICPVCKSKSILYLKTGDKYRCRRCGMEWARGEEKKISDYNAKNK